MNYYQGFVSYLECLCSLFGASKELLSFALSYLFEIKSKHFIILAYLGGIAFLFYLKDKIFGGLLALNYILGCIIIFLY